MAGTASVSVAGRMNAFEDFVRVQSDAALRQVAGQYAYDDNEHDTNELTLRGGGEEINDQLERQLNERLDVYKRQEYGIESTDDETLRRINRGHTFAVSAEAVRKTAERGILVGGHIILGLPGEKREMLIGQAGVLSQLPLTTLKLHQLQLIKGTRMASEMCIRDRFHVNLILTLNKYYEKTS